MRRRIASVARNASGSESLRLAESSSVRSIHCELAVSGAFCAVVITNRASEQMRSERMGFCLYAMAEEPIWPDSNGSERTPSCCSRRTSPPKR